MDRPPPDMPAEQRGFRPRGAWRERVQTAVPRTRTLDATQQSASGENVFPTVYDPATLLVTGPALGDETQALLHQAARSLGWQVTLGPVSTGASQLSQGLEPQATQLSAVGVMTISVSAAGDEDRVAVPVDSWLLLERARQIAQERDRGSLLRHVGLDHVLRLDGPFDRLGFDAIRGPLHRSGRTSAPGIDSYNHVGTGARQVVSYIGPPPARDPSFPEPDQRRPVIAYMDSGCGSHPWLNSVVSVVPTITPGGVVGLDDAWSDPEVWPSRIGPYDGYLDPFAGHGTFVAGILHQACPDADIVSIRVTDGSGEVLESVFLSALTQLAELILADLGEGGLRIDVLCLPLSFFHETPVSDAFDPTLSELLLTLRGHGCAVVCAAGNDGFDRPVFPAALWSWPGADYIIDEPAGCAPHVAVGALNPNETSVALFSNFGEWVTLFALGVSVLSTAPPHQGAVQPGTRYDVNELVRTTLDPDDFAGGYAIGSGTSFAAPLVAGRLAQALVESSRDGSSRRWEDRIRALESRLAELAQQSRARLANS